MNRFKCVLRIFPFPPYFLFFFVSSFFILFFVCHSLGNRNVQINGQVNVGTKLFLVIGWIKQTFIRKCNTRTCVIHHRYITISVLQISNGIKHRFVSITKFFE